MVEDLCKSYKGVSALRGISFSVERGATFALLGPNGAGKTTTIEILEGYRRRDSGNVAVLGIDPDTNNRRFREQIGIVLQSTALEPELTVLETVKAFSLLYPRPVEIPNLLERVDLASLQHKRVRTLSGGQKRRLDVALGLVGDPGVIFLDEPTTGLDPEARRKIWNLISDLASTGKTILLSSHHMEEVERLADRVAILLDGAIRAEGTTAELRDAFTGTTEIKFFLEGGYLPEHYPNPLRPITTFAKGWAAITVANPAPVLADLTNWAFRQRISLNYLTVQRPNLEDIYLKFIGTEAPSKEWSNIS
ncbi:ABC-2 type transport system ATP-binding protein [Rhodoligotrophos appendicifer]|uniref:ABC transporter ATP-binding protein n=1 Tax=Rhodoligotrophos appendicifer TaxID=987056 RepID=UPI00196036D7|nr:ABC transporter ATP-binding protein [Rhodoligotrophos appendicifer]